jgi:hypothetical protein
MPDTNESPDPSCRLKQYPKLLGTKAITEKRLVRLTLACCLWTPVACAPQLKPLQVPEQTVWPDGHVSQARSDVTVSVRHISSPPQLPPDLVAFAIHVRNASPTPVRLQADQVQLVDCCARAHPAIPPELLIAAAQATCGSGPMSACSCGRPHVAVGVYYGGTGEDSVEQLLWMHQDRQRQLAAFVTGLLKDSTIPAKGTTAGHVAFGYDERLRGALTLRVLLEPVNGEGAQSAAAGEPVAFEFAFELR